MAARKHGWRACRLGEEEGEGGSRYNISIEMSMINQ